MIAPSVGTHLSTHPCVLVEKGAAIEDGGSPALCGSRHLGANLNKEQQQGKYEPQ